MYRYKDGNQSMLETLEDNQEKSNTANGMASLTEEYKSPSLSGMDIDDTCETGNSETSAYLAESQSDNTQNHTASPHDLLPELYCKYEKTIEKANRFARSKNKKIAIQLFSKALIQIREQQTHFPTSHQLRERKIYCKISILNCQLKTGLTSLALPKTQALIEQCDKEIKQIHHEYMLIALRDRKTVTCSRYHNTQKIIEFLLNSQYYKGQSTYDFATAIFNAVQHEEDMSLFTHPFTHFPSRREWLTLALAQAQISVDCNYTPQIPKQNLLLIQKIKQELKENNITENSQKRDKGKEKEFWILSSDEEEKEIEISHPDFSQDDLASPMDISETQPVENQTETRSSQPGYYEDELQVSPDLNKCRDNFYGLINNGLFGRGLSVRASKTEKHLQKPAHLVSVSDPGILPKYVIQIPSNKDLLQMKDMPAGNTEDQKSRLTRMIQVIEKMHQQHPMLPIMTTEGKLPDHWECLFKAIKEESRKNALQLFHAIPGTDNLLISLLAVHSSEYLQRIIGLCIDARRRGKKSLNPDVIIKPGTFEISIRDIATTLFNPAQLCFSFGLPTHHAYKEEGAGFCVFNKTAVVMKYQSLTHQKPINFVTVGTDINSDDGLRNISSTLSSNMNICHIDIFDSRVYPHHNHSSINEEFSVQANPEKENILLWKEGQFSYYAVDLSLTTRKDSSMRHPALIFALDKIKENITFTKEKGAKLFLCLPTGWDSHQEETAYCGKFINNEYMMTPHEAKMTRFNDEDISFFLNEILVLYHINQEHIAGIYWGLEGGYEPEMYNRQIEQMLQTIINQPFLQHAEENRPQMCY